MYTCVTIVIHNNCFSWLLPKTTSATQPVDAGLGRLVKFFVGKEFEDWLEPDDNLHLWEAGKLSASEKRILVAKFVGAAWDHIFLSGKYNPAAFFKKTGCLMTLDVLSTSPQHHLLMQTLIMKVSQKQKTAEVTEVQPDRIEEPKVRSDVTEDDEIEFSEREES